MESLYNFNLGINLEDNLVINNEDFIDLNLGNKRDKIVVTII